MSEAPQVIDNEPKHRFEITLEGHLAQVQYRKTPKAITYIHTEVPAALNGKGIGNMLARGVLEYAKSHQLEVIPLCPFIAAYIKKHAEYQSLVRKPAKD